MIPLASDLLPFPGQMRREDHLKSASLPDRLSSSGSVEIVGTISRKCPAVRAASVEKITQIFAAFIPGRLQTLDHAQVGYTLGVTSTKLVRCTTCIGI